MKLRSKLLLAQVPLVAGVVVCALVANAVVTQLSTSSDRILKENYRSVLAAQRMKEALERIDSGVLFVLADRADVGAAQARAHMPTIDEELRAEEANLTEPLEGEAAARLRAQWQDYRKRVDRFIDEVPTAQRGETYFDELAPTFQRTKEAADVILAMNQDAMVRKRDESQRLARRFELVLTLSSAAALVLALLASSVMTVRILRPLGVLTQVARRLGQGDLKARGVVTGNDEIRLLAGELNAMADHLEAYRRSSIGELIEAQEAAQAAIDSLGDPVIVFDAAAHVTNSNAVAARLLGIDVERHPKQPLLAADAAVREAIERVRSTVASSDAPHVPQGLDEAMRLPTSDGDRSFLLRAMPIHTEEGAMVGVTVVLQDVTRLLRIDDLKNDLVATVAHELRTPLTSLHMAIHLCLDESVGPLTHKQQDLLFAARDDCNRLQDVVGELLDLSRIQAGRLVLARRAVPTESIVDAVVDALRASAGERKVELERAVLPGVGELDADPDRIELVLTNLVSNAVRYSPPHSTVTVEVRPEEAFARFSVIDHGPGVPREFQERIFEKYFQIPGANKGGAGLGLYIAKEIVEAHGGRLSLHSEPGQGATFTFTVPRVR